MLRARSAIGYLLKDRVSTEPGSSPPSAVRRVAGGGRRTRDGSRR
jgi:hypothetical protein